MTAALLPDGRLHLQDGPIDLIIAAHGDDRALPAAAAAFRGLLAGLAAELPGLRAPVGTVALTHPVALRMVAACLPHAEAFITPMAAVAGAVADHILAAMVTAAPGLRRAWVNNGGDIALHLAPGEVFRVGLVPELAVDGQAVIVAADPVRGIATSGWPGRSFSLGIADAVTVLAGNAAAADAAATMIANAVDAEHPAIQREAAEMLDPDSDLGARLVTVAVGPLPEALVADALAQGLAEAETLRGRGLILGALLRCQGQQVATGAGYRLR
ncbi:hypothetical protein C8P66_1033 [Humitalea rosea]|uniref:Uncharacterized protein n=1 Tax=Humitalea rosea TaxID=990373 RepID=A0A2W7KKZ9_9PROT|nr:UPF0280 family protein [Humitalea rosea]PZW48978.1 hypothetical protein C8P66_1033 [Humitalea rosea]